MTRTLYWKNNSIYILDQRLLPSKTAYIRCHKYLQVAKTIKEMAIRGAPAIGVAAGFGMALAVLEKRFTSLAHAKAYLSQASAALAATRPTAVNLFWALERMHAVIRAADSLGALTRTVVQEAQDMYRQDIAINRKIGENGATLFKKKSRILTHCNAGALATAGYGTALGVIRSAHARRKVAMVYVDETRPYLQGARLTAWEMQQEKIPYVLITDNMAGYFIQKGEIDAVIVGADRIAANGDTANKIGTYTVSVLAYHHHIPFYVAAPVSTIDLKTKSGSRIRIEERSTEEVVKIQGQMIAPRGTVARHPAFDVTPAKYITAIITEKGVVSPKNIGSLFRGGAA